MIVCQICAHYIWSQKLSDCCAKKSLWYYLFPFYFMSCIYLSAELFYCTLYEWSFHFLSLSTGPAHLGSGIFPSFASLALAGPIVAYFTVRNGRWCPITDMGFWEAVLTLGLLTASGCHLCSWNLYVKPLYTQAQAWNNWFLNSFFFRKLNMNLDSLMYKLLQQKDLHHQLMWFRNSLRMASHHQQRHKDLLRRSILEFHIRLLV